jgi:hypothetical protein
LPALARTDEEQYRLAVPESFDVDAMITRFQERAAAVRRRSLPPLEGAERQLFKAQMELDYMDFAILGDAEGALEQGVLTLRVDLRPQQGREGAEGENET